MSITEHAADKIIIITDQSSSLIGAPADLRYIEEIVARSGTSFARGMRILEPARRDAMFAIYAFCRIVDDIADGEAGAQPPKEALENWRNRIEALYRGESRDALERVLLAAIGRFHLQKEDFLAVIDGMEMDCGPMPIIAPDEAMLDLYCDRVASAVGRLSVRIFGVPEGKGKALAHHLGRALQLTNILRDLAEDAAIGRLYLPKELLVRFSVPAKPADIAYYHGLDDLCRILAMRAHDHFRMAIALMRRCPINTVRPAAVMAESYKVTLEALERRGWRHPDEPVRICGLQKRIRVFLACIGIYL